MNITKMTKNSNRFLIHFLSDSMFIQVMNVGGVFMTSLILMIGANEKHIGIMAAIPWLTNALQVFSVYIYKKLNSRKKVVLNSYYVQFGILILMFSSVFLLSGQLQMILFLIPYSIAYIMRAIRGGGLLEWNNFYVPEETSGRYYSTRNLLANILGIMLMLLIGWLLDIFNGPIPYLIILAFFFIIVVVGLLALNKVEDRKDGLKTLELNLKDIFTKPFADKKFINYVGFIILWNFANLISYPYCTFYSVEYLNLSYSFVGTVMGVTCGAKILIARFWGISGDKYGWKKVIMVTGCGYALSSFFWFFIGEGSTYFYIFIRLFNGLFMIGINIAIFNLKFKMTNGENRLIYLGFQETVVGIFSFIAPNLSSLFVGFMKTVLSTSGPNPFQIMFVISGCLQLLSIYYIINVLFKEESNNKVVEKGAA